ncbi:hypothetical protein [Rhizobium laguerreae]|uniref:hypothetical protein n=1 Tax=Rhizobium laguerreae TaxID=1076926 RepID=UPI001C90DDE9|nr:hypothetical protein [Rhizobium laguerreae]MBY3493883.1 hypothetical protein [Rhizobium laguerreae]
MQEQFIHDDAYHSALDQLEAIARTFEPAAPDDLRTRIIEVLGDLGIWPVTCFPRDNAEEFPLAA